MHRCAGQYVQLYRYAIEINCVSAYHRCWTIAYVSYVSKVEWKNKYDVHAAIAVVAAAVASPLTTSQLCWVHAYGSSHFDRTKSMSMFHFTFTFKCCVICVFYFSFSASPDSCPIHVHDILAIMRDSYAAGSFLFHLYASNACEMVTVLSVKSILLANHFEEADEVERHAEWFEWPCSID